jgi:thiol-disulfide isomerase/thioredoxin
MKYFYLLLLCQSFSIISNSQVRTYDILDRNAVGKQQVIYFTGLWCAPCMAKLKPVMDSFSKRKDIEFIVLFDRYGISEQSLSRLSAKFDTSYFRILPARYYPADKAKPFLNIKVNPSNRAIKALVADYNKQYHTSYTTDTIWVGVAFLGKKEGYYITKEHETSKLISEINLFLKEGK